VIHIEARRPINTPIRVSIKIERLLHLVAMAFVLPTFARAQEAGGPDHTTTLESVQVIGNWLGTGLQSSVKDFPGARSLMMKDGIEASGAGSIGEVMRRIPGVQTTENSGSAGSMISLNVGVRGLTGRYTPRSTVLLDGVPLAVAPYGQPQLSFAPVSLNSIQSIDVVRSGGAVRYGPQNVGGIINFETRGPPSRPGFESDASARHAEYVQGGGQNTQYSAFVGDRLESGVGLALLYSGMTGRDWRAGSNDRFDDVALKARYDINVNSEVTGKVAYYRVKSRTPGGLTVAQYDADPFQNTRPSDYWSGERKSIQLGYVNAVSTSAELEVRTYYNDSLRQSALINAAKTELGFQPRNYTVLGIEPRFTRRISAGPTVHDLTFGYRYVRERGDENAYSQIVASGALGDTTTFNNTTDAHSVYVDDRISSGAWRLTPGVRFEHIASTRVDVTAGQIFETINRKALPSMSIAFLATPTLTLFTNYTTSFGPVQNAQLNSQSAANPLKPELARTAEIGARWTDAQVHAEVTAFRIRFDNQIQQVAGVTPTLFQNVGATKHEGIETAIDFTFDPRSGLSGLSVIANLSLTRALQQWGSTAGRDLPFYARTTDTLGARYVIGAWGLDVSSTHQSGQFSDNANTTDETANAGVGRIPGFRLWNAQVRWTLPGTRSVDVRIGANNISDKRYYTRSIDGNLGRMVGAPRTIYVYGRLAF
jgi:Fe(3+) dicitrate transport protein